MVEIYIEALTEGLAERPEIRQGEGREEREVICIIRHIQPDCLTDHAKHPGTENADQNGALDIPDMQRRSQKHADECKKRTDAGG